VGGFIESLKGFGDFMAIIHTLWEIFYSFNDNFMLIFVILIGLMKNFEGIVVIDVDF